MKSKCSFILKASTALVLALLMLFGTVATSIAAVADDLAETGYDTTNGGMKIDTKIYTSSGEKAAWAGSGLNSSSYADFDILDAGRHNYKIYGDKWFGSVSGWGSSVWSDSNTYNTTYNAHNNGSSDDITATFPAGQYVLHLTAGGGNDVNYVSYTLYRKKAYIDYGWNSGGWTGYNMTYEGDGVYKYTITGTGDQLRFRSRFIDGSSEDDYYPSSTDDIRDNTSYSSGYGASTGSSSNYWHIDTQSGATYTVYLKNARVWIVVSGESYGYSLWGGDSKEFDSKGYLAPLTLNAATGLYDGSYTFNSTNWHSFVISASDSTSSFSTAWTSYSEVGWALDTYNNNATYQNYSSNHKEEMSDGLFSFVEITDRSSQYGLKLAARAEGTTINLSYDATNKILWLWGGTGSDKAIIYAKDGCINENRNTTRVLGTTTVTAVTDIVTDVERKSISNTECYTYAKAVKGEEITVTTTVADDYASKYLVKGWDVNGTTYGLDPTAVGTAYSATFTVPDADKVEITPIYWLKNGDVTTFFVKDFNNVPDGWGSALYYYYWGGSQVNVDNEEKYPGQPFVHEGGQYYAQVPTDVTGVTLNNAVWDTIHGTYIMGVSGNESANHWQTYDYDNFAKIVKEKTDLNSVYFTFKYESTKDNLGSATAASGSTITLSDYGTNGNGWEEYKNPLGEDINIFSEVLTSPGTGILYVVSNGYARNYQGDYATEWSVYYDSSGSGSTASFVGTIPSSALILDSSSDFATYSDSGYGPDITDYQNVWTTLKNTYSNYKVKITYEKGIYGGNTLINTSAKTKSGGTDNATRIDGKWDFILNSSYSTANIIIQKSTDNGSTYTEDTFVTNTNQGTTTQATAYFNNTGESYSGTHEVTTANEVVVSTTDKYKLKTVPNATTGYQFVGWYRLDDGSETPELISTSTEAESLMSSKATFIARYKYVTSGNLVINHAVNGEGKSTNHTVKVEIFADDATPGSDDPITSFTGESVTLGSTYISSNSTYKIRVTLTAIADANTSYIANSSAVPTVACSQDAATYYNNPSYTRTGRFATSVYPQNVVTTVDTFTIASLYGGDTSQNFTVLNYTTTFNKLPTYTINYKYHGRGMSGSDYLTFTRTITLSADEAEGKNAEGNDYSGNNGTALRPTYTTTQGDGLVNDITANAPDQNSLETDVFNKNISWSVPSTVTASPLTVYATETDPTYTLTYTYYDVNGTAHSAQTVTGSYNTLIRFGETSGTVATASTKGGQKFAYWADANDKPLTNSILYSMRLIDNVTIHPVYGTLSSGWESAIDKITRTHETSDTSDNIFTDFALRFTGFDSNGAFIHINPDHLSNYKVGVAVVYDTAGDNTTETTEQINDSAFYDLSKTTKYQTAQQMVQLLITSNITSARLSQVSDTTYVTRFEATNSNLTNFNRIDLAVKYNYKQNYKRKYDAYAYIVDKNNQVIAVSPVKSGYLYDGTLPVGN